MTHAKQHIISNKASLNLDRPYDHHLPDRQPLPKKCSMPQLHLPSHTLPTVSKCRFSVWEIAVKIARKIKNKIVGKRKIYA